MNDFPENTHDYGPHLHAQAAPTTQQIRTVGQRRRDAEEKLEHHLQEARHKDHHDEAAEHPEAAERDQAPNQDQAPERDQAPKQDGAETVESSDVAAIQDDEALTAADRVDLIANQVVPEDGESHSDK
ncbi:MAG: hypothetical protein JWQ75_1786 [Pseudarthrobacter sp.]|nr:hypothetical protein [Pseudarthrobacter sp.]